MTASPLTVRVAAIETLAPLIKAFHLETLDGSRLPGFTPGSHISLRIPLAVEAWRAYSLVHLDQTQDSTIPQDRYTIAVRREESGQGGSRWLHEQIESGSELTLRPPSNHFPLLPADDIVLVAGGIGITPIASMAAALKRARRPFQLHYTGRSASQMAWTDRLSALFGADLHLHYDDDPASAFQIQKLLSRCRPTQPLYACGPQGMIDALMTAARDRGWNDNTLHSELFSAPQAQEGDRAFDVLLQSSGKMLHVPADRSLLDVLSDAGQFITHDCRTGFCGLCSVGVLDGEIDHRDDYLLESDKAAGKVMQVCVSRAKSALLVLDL